LLHFFKRIDVDLVPGRLYIPVKIANFADAKTQAREGRKKAILEGKGGRFRTIVPEESQSIERQLVLRTASASN
jgi:hypothetical protein